MNGALHGTPLPNGTVLQGGEPGSSWTSIGIPKSKLVMALGWFHQQWMANKSSTKNGGGENGDTLGRRISFCQAVALYNSVAGTAEERAQVRNLGPISAFYSCIPTGVFMGQLASSGPT